MSETAAPDWRALPRVSAKTVPPSLRFVWQRKQFMPALCGAELETGRVAAVAIAKTTAAAKIENGERVDR
jgi:hypothetical protein